MLGGSNAIFVCVYCNNKLANWDREKEDRERRNGATRLPGLSVRSPQLASMNRTQLRCCLSIGCIDYLDWLSEEEAEGRPIRGWDHLRATPWDTDGKLGHLFEKLGLRFDLPACGQTALCGVKAPVWPFSGGNGDAGGVAALGPMRRLSARLAPTQ